MTHEIMGQRFLERQSGTPAWHGLGNIFPVDDQITASEAIMKSGANLTISKVPLSVTLPDGNTLLTGEYMLWREVSEFGGVVDAGAIVGGPVSREYTPLQNIDIGAALDPLSKVWPVETVGILQEGQRIFISLYGGEFDIKGDPHKLFFVATDSKSGKESMKIITTPVRVVCANTLAMGKAAANFSAKISHTPEAYRDMAFWSAVIPQIAANAQRTKETLQKLADTKATKAAAEFVINQAFKAPAKSGKMKVIDSASLSLDQDHKDQIDADTAQYDYFSARTAGIRAAAHERLDVFNQDNPATAGTLFAVAQAANEVACWRNGHAETVDENVVFGERSKESARAFTAALLVADRGLDRARIELVGTL